MKIEEACEIVKKFYDTDTPCYFCGCFVEDEAIYGCQFDETVTEEDLI